MSDIFYAAITTVLTSFWLLPDKNFALAKLVRYIITSRVSYQDYFTPIFWLYTESKSLHTHQR